MSLMKLLVKITGSRSEVGHKSDGLCLKALIKTTLVGSASSCLEDYTNSGTANFRLRIYAGLLLFACCSRLPALGNYTSHEPATEIPPPSHPGLSIAFLFFLFLSTGLWEAGASPRVAPSSTNGRAASCWGRPMGGRSGAGQSRLAKEEEGVGVGSEGRRRRGRCEVVEEAPGGRRW